ncbi:set domain protein [Phlyctema vagabunda]|uniref:Set domain protein n=1 Tax=Phlyctema vagabunda TaxID=108571 RepID=A0ABR4PXR2_9HELO
MYRRHFEYHGDPKTREDQRLRCHWCQIRQFSTHEKYPIAIINDVDNAELPENFQFIEKSILGRGVEPADDAFRSGCECVDDRECERRDCHCLEDMDLDDRAPADAKVYMYHSTGSKKECLRSAVLGSRDPIYECHSSCACSQECNNRVVERGRKIRLEIFRTKDRGWGVRSRDRIKKGQYIDKYVGEILTADEANKRREASDVAQQKDVYLFALDKFSNPDDMDPRLAGPPLEVDGEFFSGPTRFVNHSCDPNLRSFARVGDHADKHLHDLALFAIRDIEIGEELTFDYVDGEETDLEEDSRNPSKKKDMTKCLCGSKNCRGFLW